jgi:tRNA 2-thiouridine synthesizing protein A
MRCPMSEPETLDVQGLLCPLPVLKARKRLRAMAHDQILRVLATDPAALIDVPHFCMESGHELLGVDEIDGGAHAFLIRRR